MTASPLVTIGIASFNNAAYIAETLRSVARQTYTNIELVVVDDCSADNSLEVINESLKSFDFPKKLIVHERNKGVVAVCNRLLDEVNGDFFCFVGSDDVFMPDKVEVQVRSALEHRCDLVFSAMEYIDSEGRPVSLDNFNKLPAECGAFELSWAFLLGGSFITAPTVMIRTSTAREAGGYDPRYLIEDMPLWMKLAGMGARMWYIGTPLVKYRMHSASQSASPATLISHARVVEHARHTLPAGDRWRVNVFMWHRIVSLSKPGVSFPRVPAGELVCWIRLLNRNRLFHYLLYKILHRMVGRASFRRKLEEISRRPVFSRRKPRPTAEHQ